MTPPPSRLRIAAAYALCCAVWGSTWLVIKIGLTGLPPFWFAGLRMGIACLVLTPLALRKGLRSVSRADGLWIAFCGLLQIGFCYALVFKAEGTMDSGLTAMLFGTFPIWVALLAHAFLPEEPLSPRRALAAVLGFGGVAVLEWSSVNAFTWRASAIATLPLIAAALAAVSNITMKRRLSSVSPVTNLWGQTLAGSVFLLALAAAVREPFPAVWSVNSVLCLSYLSLFGTVIAFLALFWLIPRIPMSAIGAIPVIDTLIAVLLGTIVLAEPLSGRIVAGGALILFATALANRAESSAPA